jgi:hypothetical protein
MDAATEPDKRRMVVEVMCCPECRCSRGIKIRTGNGVAPIVFMQCPACGHAWKDQRDAPRLRA